MLPFKLQKALNVVKTEKRPSVRTHEVSPPETDRFRSTQPYGSRYFLSRKIVGKAGTSLLNAGCSTNLLSWQLFYTLGT